MNGIKRSRPYLSPSSSQTHPPLKISHFPTAQMHWAPPSKPIFIQKIHSAERRMQLPFKRSAVSGHGKLFEENLSNPRLPSGEHSSTHLDELRGP